MELEKTISDRRDQENSVWMVSAPVRAMRYINDLHYMAGDRERAVSGEVGARKKNVQFRVAGTVSREEYTELLQETALRSLKIWEQLFRDRENRFMF